MVTSTPDCANSGGQFSSTTTFTGAGGTSAAAPAFAGMLALVVQATGGRLGQVDSVLYQLAQAHPSYFHDVTSGDNSVPCAVGSPNCGSNGFLTGYNAATGYDLASGIGSVDAAAIVNNWNNVHLGSSSTTLQINGSTAAYSGVHGASLAFNVGVTGSGGTPTGVVAITDNANMTSGGTASGPQNNSQFAIPLTGGSGTNTYNGLPGGTYSVSGRYGGDTSFAASTSAPVSVTISPEPSTTTLTVNAYDSSTGKPISTTNIPYGSYVFADAEITGTAEGLGTQGIATGTVGFLSGSTILGTVSVNSGNQASWPPLTSNFAALSGGSYNLTAQYSGDASFKSSTSSSVPITVVQATTTVSAQSTLYNLATGDSATIIVNVNAAPSGGVPPTGNVTITANGTTLATISNLTPSGFSPFGNATIQANQLSPGVNVVTVKYSGDVNYSSSSTALSIDYVGNGGFSISPIPGVAVSPGSTVITPLTLSPSGGFDGAVVFGCSVSGEVNNNLTCEVSPDYVVGSGPASGMISIAATSSAVVGTYSAALNGQSISNPKIKATSAFTITVSQNPTPSLAIFSNGNLSVSPGSSVGNTTSVTINPSGGFSGQLNLTCAVTTAISNAAGQPTCSTPASVTIAGTQASIIPVSVATSTTTTTGDYTVTVTATAAATPAITGSSTADLTVTSSPAFALASGGSVTLASGSATGNTSVTATPMNGYSGTINLACILTTLSTAPGSSNQGGLDCNIPQSVVVSATNPASFTVTFSSPGNPSYPGPGVYLATVSGYDTASTSITSETAIEITIGTPNAALALSNSGAITVNPGATTGNTSTITVTPSGGFTGTVNLSCAVTTSISNPTDLPACSVPASVNISGTTAATVTLAVSTTAPATSALHPLLNRFLAGSGGAALAIVLLFGLPARRRAWRTLFSIIALVVVVGTIGCGGGSASGGGGGGGSSNLGTTAGSYTITVTGKDSATGKITVSTVVSLTVN